MVRNKSVALISFAVVTSLLVTACGGSKSAQAPSAQPSSSSGPKTLTIGIFSSPDSFNFITNKTTYGSLVYGLIYPSLYVMNDQLQYQPSLATSLDVNDKQDQFVFHLNPKAKWSDGQAITADDVAYTIEVIAQKDTPTTRRSLIDTIQGLDKNGVSESGGLDVKGIKVKDANTIEFDTKTPVDKDAFMEKVAAGISIMPKHTLEPFVKANLKGLDKADITMNPTVSGGPFKFVQYKTDSYVELAANPDYFGGKPKLDKVFFKIVNQASFTAAVQKGEIDVTSGNGTGEISIQDWDQVSKDPNLVPVTYTAPSYQYLDFNDALPMFSKPAIREAFAHAINRPLIVQRLLHGMGEVLNTPLTSTNKYYNKDIQSALQYDPALAKKMLQDNGWDFNTEITILTPTGNAVREQSADIIQANLQDVGVKVKIEKVDFPTRQSRSAAGQFQISLVGFSATFDPDISSQVATGQGYNDRKYSNPQMDTLLAQGKTEVKFDSKKAVYDQIQKLFIQDVPYLPLYATKTLAVVNKRVIGAKPGPNGLDWNAVNWDVK
ncbi:MAG: ABC transporter substrate-binding protein [Mycobacterium leprae]